MVKSPGHMNKLIHKLRAQQGFSMTELLVTLILVGLITTAVAGGISMVARSYTRVVDRADAEQLLATTLNKMQDELGFARVDLETPANADVCNFISGVSGLRIRFRPGDANTGAVQEFMQGDAASTTVKSTYQFTDKNLISGNRMYVTYDHCRPEYVGDKFTGRFIIENLRVESTKSDAQALAQLPMDKNGQRNYYVAAINYRE